MSYDALVIGAGPAGLSAAINLRARGKSVLIISNPPEENPLWRAERVENYPGLPGVSGSELLTAMLRHAETDGAEFLSGRALAASPAGEGGWYVSVGSDVREAKAVILAAGVSRGKKFPGEAELLGRGVSYCATCDGRLYRNRPVAVIGYTDSARREAAFLEEIGCAVRYFHRPGRCEIRGRKAVEAVVCDGEAVPVDGVFVLRPSMAPADLFPGLGLKQGYVVADKRMATNLPGVFAAGDCTGGPLQVAKAVGEGLIAGQSAAAYIDGLTRKQPQN